jgi:hypothetical protein
VKKPALLTLIATAIVSFAQAADSIPLTTTIPPEKIGVEASSSRGGKIVPDNLINGKWIINGFYENNTDSNAMWNTMWHSGAKLQPSSPALSFHNHQPTNPPTHQPTNPPTRT